MTRDDAFIVGLLLVVGAVGLAWTFTSAMVGWAESSMRALGL